MRAGLPGVGAKWTKTGLVFLDTGDCVQSMQVSCMYAFRAGDQDGP